MFLGVFGTGLLDTRERAHVLPMTFGWTCETLFGFGCFLSHGLFELDWYNFDAVPMFAVTLFGFHFIHLMLMQHHLMTNMTLLALGW